jgi:TonB family protein
VITSADFSETVPRDAEKLTSKGTRERFLLNDLLANILQPMPSPDRLQGTIITHEERTIGKAELDCFVVGSARSKVTLYRENFCTEPNEISLRLKTYGSSLLIRNRDAKFQGVEVAMDYTLSIDGKKTIDAQIADLRTTQPEAVPGRLTIPSDAVQHVPGVVLAGKIIEKQPPTYPEMARRNHIVGTVLLGAVIGKDGSVSSLAVIASPDESLSESAMDAVKHWKYEPYMLDGAPIPVATTIGVNFNMPR